VNVLITGIGGFVGSRMAEYLLKKEDIEVHGTLLKGERTSNIDSFRKELSLSECDITNKKQVFSAVKESSPDFVFHFAGQSNVTRSWDIPTQTMDANVTGSVNVLDALKELAPGTRVLLASSREVYGKAEPEEPLTENSPLNPVNPYGSSKLAMEFIAMQYHQAFEVEPIIIRSFNLTGPGRPADFVCSDWAKQVAEIDLGLRKPIIETGNIGVVRDFTDVRDAIEAYWLAVQKCEPAEPFNVCSGVGRNMRDVLAQLMMFSSKEPKAVCKEEKIVKIGIPFAVGSHKKLTEATGWKPKIQFEQTLLDLVNYWKKGLNA